MEEQIKKLWTKIIPPEEIERGDAGATYKGPNPVHTVWAVDSNATVVSPANLLQDAIETLDGLKSSTETIDGSETPEKLLTETEIVDDVRTTTSIDDAVKDDTSLRNLPFRSASNYELQQEISRGGMGIVFLGRQISLRRDVAIKRILTKKDIVSHREKFIAESLVTAYLDHPNIVPVHELCETPEGKILLVMKLVEGTEWSDFLKGKGDKQYDLEGHLEILLDVCHAVDYAHSKGIVHNDLKPANIMVGKFGEVLVMDWGIAVDVRDREEFDDLRTIHRSTVSFPMGTPSYMPWELAEGCGTKIGPWTDTYLLGAILYEILTGEPPHRGNPLQALVASVTGAVPAFSTGIPDELEKICRKAMHREIEQRYQSVQQFQHDIRGFLQHRESIVITENAQKLIENCHVQTDNASITLDRNRLYDDFAQAIACFHQAIALWPDNNKAAEGEKIARLGYARAAAHNADFGLAEAQLDKLGAQNPEVLELREYIKKAEEMQECKAISQRAANIALLFCYVFPAQIFISIFFADKKAFFIQGDAPSIAINALLAILSIIGYRIFRNSQYRMKPLLYRVFAFELSNVFFSALLAASYPHSESDSTTGVFAPVVTILLFRIVVPLSPKVALTAGFFAATMSIVTLLLGKMLFQLPFPPEHIIMPYIGQHYALAAMGVILAETARRQATRR